jgi:hypothetical protein
VLTRDRHVEGEPEQRLGTGIEPDVPRHSGTRVEVEQEHRTDRIGEIALRVQHELQATRRARQRVVRQEVGEALKLRAGGPRRANALDV